MNGVNWYEAADASVMMRSSSRSREATRSADTSPGAPWPPAAVQNHELMDEVSDKAGSGVPNLAGTAGEGSVALAGRTRQDKLVHFAGQPSVVGRRVAVDIDFAGPFALRGRVVATQA